MRALSNITKRYDFITAGVIIGILALLFNVTRHVSPIFLYLRSFSAFIAVLFLLLGNINTLRQNKGDVWTLFAIRMRWLLIIFWSLIFFLSIIDAICKLIRQNI